MELGELSQLKVYENAMKVCSDNWNRSAVEMYGKLICEIAGRELDN